jgi:hypothetical protein
MAEIWTHGVWTVKPGREDEFVRAWRELVPVGTAAGAGAPTLLCDRDRPNVFRSFGPWPDLDAIQRFRSEIRPRLGEMNDLLEGVELFTLDEVYPGG